MFIIMTSYTPKEMRETLCRIQSLYYAHVPIKETEDKDGEMLQNLINEIDRHRPLGPDGKHGDRHTETCGCHTGSTH